LANAVQQEACLAIQSTAGHRRQQVPDQAARHFRGEQHRHAAGGQRSWLQAGDSTLGGTTSDQADVLQVLASQRTGVPAVTLHAIALPGDQRTTDRMVGAALTADETMRIGIDRQALHARHRGAVGIADLRIGLTACGFASQGQVHRLVGLQRPRVPAVQVREVGGHQGRFGQAGGRVIFGMPGDGTGLLDRGRQAGLVQVAGAGAALALAEIHSDGDAAVAGGLHGFDLAEADIHLQSTVFAAADFSLAGAQRAGAVEQLLGEVGQPFQPGRAVVADGGFRGDHVQCFILYGLGPASRRATFFEIRYGRCADATKKPVNSTTRAAARTGATRSTSWPWAKNWCR